MKKILALLISVILVFSLAFLTSCDGNTGGEGGEGNIETLAGKTPEELYNASVEALSNATSYEVIGENEIEMDMSVEGASIFVVMNQSTHSKVNGDDVHTKVTSTTDMIQNGQTTSLGDVAPMETWYIGGVCYTDMQGVKVKSTVDKETFMQEYMGKDPQESTLMDIPESWFKDINFEESEEGGYVLNMVVSGEEFTQYMGNIFEDTEYNFQIVGDVNYKIYFDSEGNLTKITADFDMSYSISGVDGTATCHSVSKVSIKEVEVEGPANPDEFQEVEL